MRCWAKRTIRSNRKGDWPDLLPQIRGTTPDSKQPPMTFPGIADKKHKKSRTSRKKTQDEGCSVARGVCRMFFVSMFPCFFHMNCGGSTKHHQRPMCFFQRIATLNRGPAEECSQPTILYGGPNTNALASMPTMRVIVGRRYGTGVTLELLSMLWICD